MKPQATPKASNEVVSEPDETLNETSDSLNTTPELDLEPESEPPKYQLPTCINRGKLKTQYDADLNSKGKYPISNHVSTHRLSKSYESFLCQISTVSIPRQL